MATWVYVRHVCQVSMKIRRALVKIAVLLPHANCWTLWQKQRSKVYVSGRVAEPWLLDSACTLEYDGRLQMEKFYLRYLPVQKPRMQQCTLNYGSPEVPSYFHRFWLLLTNYLKEFIITCAWPLITNQWLLLSNEATLQCRYIRLIYIVNWLIFMFRMMFMSWRAPQHTGFRLLEYCVTLRDISWSI